MGAFLGNTILTCMAYYENQTSSNIRWHFVGASSSPFCSSLKTLWPNQWWIHRSLWEEGGRLSAWLGIDVEGVVTGPQTAWKALNLEIPGASLAAGRLEHLR
jgi:hypothetical protein